MAKNVLSVGALAQLQVEPSSLPAGYQRRCFIDVEGDLHFVVDARCESSSSNCDFIDALAGGVGKTIGADGGVTIVTDNADIPELATQPPHPEIVITNAPWSGDLVPFAVLYVSETLHMDRLLSFPAGTHLRFTPDYRLDFEQPDLAWFSSKGPAFNGILKPEIVAPGYDIISARSEPSGPPNHDRDSVDVVMMMGTSIACPNVAGTAALLRQYFVDEFHYNTKIEPSASLMKAVLINSADPSQGWPTRPNNAAGFGILNLGNWLPFADSDFCMVIGDNIEIHADQHLVSSFIVKGTAKDLRITMSYLDQSVNADSWIPLLSDLDLIVVSPMGDILRGNDRGDLGEEHFSTTERVIVFSDYMQIGTYEIHVICSSHGTVPVVNFSIVVVGDLDVSSPGRLEFAPANTCINDCAPGTCDSKTWICNCTGSWALGQTCEQSLIWVIPSDGISAIVISPLGMHYLVFVKPAGYFTELIINITLPGNHDYWQLLWSEDEWPKAAAWTYDENCSTPCTKRFSDLSYEERHFTAMLRSHSHTDEAFEIYFQVQAAPVSTESPDDHTPPQGPQAPQSPQSPRSGITSDTSITLFISAFTCIVGVGGAAFFVLSRTHMDVLPITGPGEAMD
jgi:hypothetical protein